MPGLSFHERQHLERLLQQQASVKYIFDEFVRKVGLHMTGWKDTGADDVWIRNKNVEKSIEKELEILHDKLVSNIETYTSDAWNRSQRKIDELVTEYVKGLPLNDLVKKGMFVRNEEALSTFLNRKIDGFKLSDKVWEVVGTGKQNIEYYLSSGLSTGRSASLISQDVRQLLKDPNKRFRRIRNADGKLVPSGPMRNFHPGRGVYRSSAKNAQRLAVTNTNEMYRIADHERWQKLDFVLGVDIRRSSSNKGPCPICDSMVGQYPKGFLYKGWHPWCICPATPILMKEDDFMKSITDDSSTPSNLVSELPETGRAYLEEMLEKDNINLDSYLFKENKQYFT